jgi:hypothetical protein
VAKIKPLLFTLCFVSSSLYSQEHPPTTVIEPIVEKKSDFEKSWLVLITLGLMFLCTARVSAHPGHAKNSH